MYKYWYWINISCHLLSNTLNDKTEVHYIGATKSSNHYEELNKVEKKMGRPKQETNFSLEFCTARYSSKGAWRQRDHGQKRHKGGKFNSARLHNLGILKSTTKHKSKVQTQAILHIQVNSIDIGQWTITVAETWPYHLNKVLCRMKKRHSVDTFFWLSLILIFFGLHFWFEIFENNFLFDRILSHTFESCV